MDFFGFDNGNFGPFVRPCRPTVKPVIAERPIVDSVLDMLVNALMSEMDKDESEKKASKQPHHFILDDMVEKLSFNNRTTVVKWKDGVTTTATCHDQDTFSEENGFAICALKYLMGGNKVDFDRELKHQLAKAEHYPKTNGDGLSVENLTVEGSTPPIKTDSDKRAGKEKSSKKDSKRNK